MSNDNSEPAFPAPAASMEHYGKADGYTGMSLRDYFAAKALPVAWQAFENGYFDSAEDSINANVATCAYQMADAMIAARGESK